ncbi:MAG: DUF2059 domain-containing protein [Burkholderiales bacterium]
MHILVRAALVAALSLPALSAWAAETLSPEKTDDIRKLMDATGVTRFAPIMARNISAQVSELVNKGKPDAPQDVYTMIAGEVNGVFKAELGGKGGYVEQMVPIFHKHFTHEDIKGLLHFYSTPLGKKTMAALPMIAQESAPVQQKWMQSVSGKLQERLRTKLGEKGINLDELMKKAAENKGAPKQP